MLNCARLPSLFDMLNCYQVFLSGVGNYIVIFFSFTMQTIAVVPVAPRGVVQLGSLDIVS